MNGEQIIRLINDKGDEILSRIVTDAHRDFATELSSSLKASWLRYTGEDKPIKHRTTEDELNLLSNEKLPNDFEGDIVDQLKGFVFAESITVKSEDESANKIIQEFITNTDFDAHKTELAEYMLSTGRAYSLLYVEAKTGNVKTIAIKSWQCSLIYSDATDEPDFGFIYYPYNYMNENGKEIKRTRLEWYDKENVYYFVRNDDSNGSFKLEEGEIFEDGEIKTLQNPQPHLFKGAVPIIEFIPNQRKQSAFEKVKKLIDGYDMALSDWLNELVEFKQSYMKATGAEIDEKERKAARATRIINLPDTDSDVDFLTKNLSAEFVEKFLKQVAENTYKFSKTVNMTDEKFAGGGPESGEARVWKMLGLVFEGKTLETYFTKGLRRLFKTAALIWNVSSNKVNYLEIMFEFTRTLPKDLLYAAQVMEKFFGKLPTEEVYALMPFIDKPKEVYERYKEEFGVDLDKYSEGNTSKADNVALQIQQLSLAASRAAEAQDTELAARLKNKIDELITQV